MNDETMIYGMTVTPPVADTYSDIATGMTSADGNSYKHRALKIDLVKKFLHWSPTLNKLYGSACYMKGFYDTGVDGLPGDADRCVTWMEVKNSENLSV